MSLPEPLSFIDRIKIWLGENKILSMVIFGVIALLFLPKLFRKKRIRRRKNNPVRSTVRRKRTYNTTGTRKKPWQIKGSRAAKLRMARLRRMR